jgi:hypothetical protein
MPPIEKGHSSVYEKDKAITLLNEIKTEISKNPEVKLTKLSNTILSGVNTNTFAQATRETFVDAFRKANDYKEAIKIIREESLAQNPLLRPGLIFDGMRADTLAQIFQGRKLTYRNAAAIEKRSPGFVDYLIENLNKQI